MVEELLPTSVAIITEMDVDEGIVFGLDGLFNEFHAGFPWHSPAFFNVTRGTGTNDVPPGGLPSLRSRDHVVEG